MSGTTRREITRREFIATSAAIGLAAGVAGTASAQSSKRKFTIALIGSAIGVSGTIRQQLDWAPKYGFESIEPKRGDLVGLSKSEISELKSEMDERDLVWAVTGAPASTGEPSEDKFKGQLKGLEVAATAWETAGVTRVKTAVMSFSNTAYLENFKLHTDRIRRIGQVLDGHGIRFGLEYLGPKTLWSMRQHAFVHTMKETQELIAAAGQDNVALVLDSWHWYCARESVADILALDGKDVVSCDLNDAPAGIEIDDQRDNRRMLPLSSGVIDCKGFLEALVKIGFDGSIMAEPFSVELDAMGDDDALRLTADSMKRAFALVG
jgi:sugar phosphate isomerase/epimerase